MSGSTDIQAFDTPGAFLASMTDGFWHNLWFRAPNFPEGLNQDPEVLGETAESNVQGFEYGSAPSTRRIGVNFTVTF